MKFRFFLNKDSSLIETDKFSDLLLNSLWLHEVQ